MHAAIWCEQLSKRYKEVVALDGLSLEVPAGSIFGFLGPNGAGKTTMVRLLTGLARPSAGRAEVAGVDVWRSDMRLRSLIGYLDQSPQFYGWMRGRELLSFVGQLFGLSGATLRARVDVVLEQTGLSEAASRRVGGYSGGMRQRLGLAQALLNQPQVLFLDEPASALDPSGRRDILELIAGLRGQATVFMSTHILSDVERVCDRVAIVNAGRLVVEASVHELQSRYAQPVVLLEAEPGYEPALARLAGSLAGLSWCLGSSLDQGLLRVTTSDPTAGSLALLSLLAEQSIPLLRFERVRPSLEDIFLKLLGGG